jgi:hypothetical protein
MTPETHALIGTGVLVLSLIVGVWAVLAGKRSKTANPWLTSALAVTMVLLGVQILAGIDLLARGGRPAPGILTIVHVGGPIIAFILGLWALLGTPRAQIRRYILADHLTFLAALVSYVIGEAFKAR